MWSGPQGAALYQLSSAQLVRRRLCLHVASRLNIAGVSCEANSRSQLPPLLEPHEELRNVDGAEGFGVGLVFVRVAAEQMESELKAASNDIHA